MTEDFTLHLPDETATLAAGARLAACLQPGLTVYLHGDLGAGKTTLVRGLLRALGYDGRVKSPTYTLVEPYVFSGFDIYHFDLYRLIDQDEWEAAGFREYFNAGSVCLLEWPERADELIPQADVHVTLTLHGDGRLLRLSANLAAVRVCLQQWMKENQ